MDNFEFNTTLNREQASIILAALELYEEKEHQLGRKEKSILAQQVWNIIFDSGINAFETKVND